MPTSTELQRLYGRVGIHRFAGLPPQFEKAECDWLFRRHGCGPAIRVTDDEDAAFLRVGLNAVVVHAVALAAFAWRLREQEVAERAGQPPAEPLWKGFLLLVFVALELAMVGGGVLLGVDTALAISGRTSEEMSFGLFMLGFLPGLAIGGLLFWPVERLCSAGRRSSAVDAFASGRSVIHPCVVANIEESDPFTVV